MLLTACSHVVKVGPDRVPERTCSEMGVGQFCLCIKCVVDIALRQAQDDDLGFEGQFSISLIEQGLPVSMCLRG